MTGSKTTGCKEILAGISAYLDGELGTAACDAIERHCQDCPSCARVVEGLRETVGLCRQAGLVPLPEAVRHRARDRIRLLLDQDQSKA
jgi:anti-sigma factor (TIGR02949 family)